MNYELRRSETCGTTGYFSVRPEGELSCESALALLAERPRDGFLKRHLAGLLPGPETAAFQQLCKKFAVAPLVAAFLAEYALERHTGQAAGQSGSPWRNLINGYAPCAALTHGFPDAALGDCRRGFGAQRRILPELAAAYRPVFAQAGGSLAELLALVPARLAQAGLLAGPEMRHEASLSPIALLRDWQLDTGSDFRSPYRLRGKLTAYGRGLSLVQARLSCLMEIVERASAFAFIDKDGKICHRDLVWASARSLAEQGERYLDPALLGAGRELERHELAWLPGLDAAGARVLVPCQAACLFLNLDEPAFCASLGSTGLGAGATREQAILSALTEVIERDAHATSPFCAGDCFVPASSDPLLQSLLDDYRYRGIALQIQDITTEIGVPCYRSFVTDRQGRVFSATAADLCGKKAALAAMTETPWPYSWATGMPSPTGPGLPDLPCRLLEDLPDYSQPGHADSLALLESALGIMDRVPVYVDLTRPDLDLPVWRAFVPGLEFDAELDSGPSLRLAARYTEKYCE